MTVGFTQSAKDWLWRNSYLGRASSICTARESSSNTDDVGCGAALCHPKSKKLCSCEVERRRPVVVLFRREESGKMAGLRIDLDVGEVGRPDPTYSRAVREHP